MFALAPLALLSLSLALPPVVKPAARANCAHLPAANAPRAASNDNRVTAGTMRDGVLVVRIVAKPVAWYPDGAQGCALRVNAFAEEGTGKVAQVPGPLIRVKAGTNVRVVVRNASGKVLWMRGLQDHNVAALDSVEIADGNTHEFQFRATAAGGWYYWGGDVNASIPRSGVDGQLVGALVVDSVGIRRPVDRVFVMTRWSPTGLPGNRGFQLNAINGLSWPNTERLTQTVGDSVKWHVINASDEVHMMHLHGFYFHMDAHGNAARDTVTASPTNSMVVTNVVRAGEWITLTWGPERAGNWLFHCHFVTHMTAEQRLDRMPGAVRAVAGSGVSAHANHAMDGMAGLILGVQVRPGKAVAAVRDTRSRRVIRLFANERKGVFAEKSGFGFVVQDGAAQIARDSIRIPGSPLVLTRGEPVAISVQNRTSQPLAIHWHGIELESYYDGVAGWSGAGARVAPATAPNDSFVVRFTPPRAGTFIYHVHNEHGDELASGLYGALIVLERGAVYDPATDLTLIIATAGPGEVRPTYVNGTATPDTLRLVAGKTYRLRLIDINANDSHRVAFVGPAGPVAWWMIARDGRDLPVEGRGPLLAPIATAAGITRDLEFMLPVPGAYAITVTQRSSGVATGHVTTLPIRVK